MKKILMLLFVFCLVGCGGQTTDDDQNNNNDNLNNDTNTGVYQDGDYKATASGYGGDFEVITTIQNDAIIDVVVSNHNETPSIGGVALEQVIKNMKDQNTYDVDMISGATKTRSE